MLASLTSLIAKVNEAKGSTSGLVKEFKSINGKGISGNNSIKDIGNEATRAEAKFKSLGSVVKSVFSLYLLKQFATGLVNIGTKAISEMSGFIENYNLFRVSMGSASAEATRFQNTMNEVMGTDMSASMRYQGFFQNLTASLGIASKESLTLSTNLTKLTYDLSSLFNVSFDSMYTKIQSGIIGQTKPLRAVGIDVTQQTLQPILDNLGIDKQVIQLTQAEKVLLRYISILKQSGNAQGDFARTLEAPANQMKVFSNQVKEAYRWFGALFIGLFGMILPYVNAVVMVMKEIFKTIAMIMGFEMPDFGYGDTTNGLDETGDAADGAAASVAKLNKQLRGWDEINNISSSTASSGGGAAAIGGMSDTYKELMKYVTAYDNKMGNVKMKALAIRDTIMSWLGFTKQVDEATGEISFEFAGWDNFYANIKSLTGIDIQPFVTSFGELWDSVSKLAGNVVDRLLIFYNDFIKPISKIVIEETLPRFFDVIDAFLKFINEVYPSANKSLDNFLNYFIVPISKIILNPINEMLKNMVLILKDLANWARSNPKLVQFINDVFLAFLAYKALMAVGGILLGISTPLALIGIAIAAIVLNYDNIKKMWDNLTPGDKLLIGLGTLATGIFLATLAVATFQSAWTLGFGIAGILVGFALVKDAINSMSKTKLSIPSSTYEIPNNTPRTNTQGGGGAQIREYADGGYPESGQYFKARENGIPELVGSIGGRTAVANNDQIVQAVSQGVAIAVSSVLGDGNKSSTPINLTVQIGSNKVGGALIDMINDSIKGGKTILI